MCIYEFYYHSIKTFCINQGFVSVSCSIFVRRLFFLLNIVYVYSKIFDAIGNWLFKIPSNIVCKHIVSHIFFIFSKWKKNKLFQWMRPLNNDTMLVCIITFNYIRLWLSAKSLLCFFFIACIPFHILHTSCEWNLFANVIVFYIFS